jgi:hypothetical protein
MSLLSTTHCVLYYIQRVTVQNWHFSPEFCEEKAKRSRLETIWRHSKTATNFAAYDALAKHYIKTTQCFSSFILSFPYFSAQRLA